MSQYHEGHYYLVRGNEAVGEAAVFEDGEVVYHLFKKLELTMHSTVPELLKKYKFVEKKSSPV